MLHFQVCTTFLSRVRTCQSWIGLLGSGTINLKSIFCAWQFHYTSSCQIAIAYLEGNWALVDLLQVMNEKNGQNEPINYAQTH
jgi:hypothetical protein